MTDNPAKLLDLDPTLPAIRTNEVVAGPQGLIRVYGSTGRGNAGVPVAGGFDVNDDGFKGLAFARIQAYPSDGMAQAR